MKVWWLSALLAIAVFAGWSSWQSLAKADRARAAADAAAAIVGTVRAPVDVTAEPDTERLPPGYRPARVARAAAGMRCPDGTFLPPLNGVAPTDPIPPIEREPFMAPIGEIVGKHTDDSGFDWWITADGSAFTTRWVTIRAPDGSLQRMVRLDQSDSLGGDALARPRVR